MYKLKLIMGLSYNGAVRASRTSPYVTVEDENTATTLVKSGHFELVSAPDTADSDLFGGFTPDTSEAELREQEANATKAPHDGEEITNNFDPPEGTENPDNADTPDNQGTPEVPEGTENPEGQESTETQDAEAEYSLDALLDMSKADLIALAEEKGVDISTCRNNERRAEVIYAALTA